MGRLKGRVAVVTGAARGIGEATSRLLASEGAMVVLTDRDQEAGERATESIRSGGGQVTFMRHDVVSEDEWAAVMEHTYGTFGALDVLVNNAGVALKGSVEETSLEQWRNVMAVNLDGVFLGTRAAIGLMKNHDGGSIVNLSSIEGLVGDPQLAAYNASKGGVRLFTKSAALHCARSGYRIRVNSVHPGYIRTPMVEEYLRAQGDLDAGLRALDQLHPVGHIGQPEDVAHGIAYLASDDARFVTGSELVIDGGYTAQ